MNKKPGKIPVPSGATKLRAGKISAPHQVRIIGGQWKRTPLAVLDVEGLRPTPDRVRETVFNWLNHLLNGQWENIVCLDLFAGTGALGFEAASRGAQRVIMVEANDQAVKRLNTIKNKLHATQVDVMQGNALSILQNHMMRSVNEGARFNLIFLDPPYHQGWLAKMLPVCEPLLAENGLVYAESEYSLDSEASSSWIAGWDIVRSDKAGMVYYHLLRRNRIG